LASDAVEVVLDGNQDGPRADVERRERQRRGVLDGFFRDLPHECAVHVGLLKRPVLEFPAGVVSQWDV